MMLCIGRTAKVDALCLAWLAWLWGWPGVGGVVGPGGRVVGFPAQSGRGSAMLGEALELITTIPMRWCTLPKNRNLWTLAQDTTKDN